MLNLSTFGWEKHDELNTNYCTYIYIGYELKCLTILDNMNEDTDYLGKTKDLEKANL